MAGSRSDVLLQGVVRPMALGFATNEILGLITHDPLEESGIEPNTSSSNATIAPPMSTYGRLC